LPKKKIKVREHPIIELLKNKIFWTVIVVTIGGSFALGFHFGNTKFDKEKIDLYEENRSLRIMNNNLLDSLKSNSNDKSIDSI